MSETLQFEDENHVKIKNPGFLPKNNIPRKKDVKLYFITIQSRKNSS